MSAVELFGEGLREHLMRWGCGEKTGPQRMMLYTDVYTPEKSAVLKTEVRHTDGDLDI